MGGTGGGGNATTPYAFLTVAVSGLGTARFQVRGGGLWPGDGWVLVRCRHFYRGRKVNFELRRTADDLASKILHGVCFMFRTLYKDKIVTLLVLGPCRFFFVTLGPCRLAAYCSSLAASDSRTLAGKIYTHGHFCTGIKRDLQLY
jgi:hypothetical protein